jgi:hypothetical protein
LALCTAASGVTGTGDSAASPYQSVVERNVFGLKPPPPPPDPETLKPPPPKMYLQGISTFGGVKRALLKAQVPAKPGVPGSGDQSMVLAEGQREGDIEVLEIDPKEGTVKVNDYGTITTLDFKHNGITQTTAPPGVPGAPGGLPHPGGGLPVPTQNVNPFTPAAAPQRLPTTRPMRLPVPNGGSASVGGESGGMVPAAYTGAAPAYYGGGAPAMAVGGTAVPLYGSTANPSQSGPAAQSVEPDNNMTAEQRFLLAELNRERLKQSGQKAPPIPPTPLTPDPTPTPTPTPTQQPVLPPRPPGGPLLPPT